MVELIVPSLGEAEIAAVIDVLRSRQLAQGAIVAAFESEFAKLLGVRHVVAVNSGTAAVHCALKAVGIGEGNEVLTTPFTFAATASAVLMQRGNVRFVDIDPRTYNVDIALYAAGATPATKAVIAVDLFGLPCNWAGADGLRSRGIAIVEDACQAIGAERDGKAAGTQCDAAAFSFYATKNIVMGEGGALATDDDAIAASARRFRQHGQVGDDFAELGYNYRLTEMLAAIGRAQLHRLKAITQARRANAAFYDDQLAGIPGVTPPYAPENVTHAYHHYAVLIDQAATPNRRGRDEVRAGLSEMGVGSGVYYRKPLHLQPLFGGPQRTGEFPVAERVAAQILSLPVHPQLSQSDRERVVSAFRSAVGA